MNKTHKTYRTNRPYRRNKAGPEGVKSWEVKIYKMVENGVFAEVVVAGDGPGERVLRQFELFFKKCLTKNDLCGTT
jgi:hypothetical protein